MVTGGQRSVTKKYTARTLPLRKSRSGFTGLVPIFHETVASNAIIRVFFHAKRDAENDNAVAALDPKVSVVLFTGVETGFLVGGFKPSEKYESQLGLLFPIYGKS